MDVFRKNFYKPNDPNAYETDDEDDMIDLSDIIVGEDDEVDEEIEEAANEMVNVLRNIARANGTPLPNDVPDDLPIDPDDAEYFPPTGGPTNNDSFESSDDSFQDDSNSDSDSSDSDAPYVNKNPTTTNNTSNNLKHSAPIDVDEEDDVVRAIVEAASAPRSHPPEIITDDFVVDLSFHPDEDILAVGTISGDVLVYKYTNEENTLLNTIEMHTKAIRDIEFNLDGSLLYTTSKDKSIMMTDVHTGKLNRFYDNAHTVPIYRINVIDENLFATGKLLFKPFFFVIIKSLFCGR